MPSAGRKRVSVVRCRSASDARNPQAVSHRLGADVRYRHAASLRPVQQDRTLPVRHGPRLGSGASGTSGSRRTLRTGPLRRRRGRAAPGANRAEGPATAPPARVAARPAERGATGRRLQQSPEPPLACRGSAVPRWCSRTRAHPCRRLRLRLGARHSGTHGGGCIRSAAEARAAPRSLPAPRLRFRIRILTQSAEPLPLCGRREHPRTRHSVCRGPTRETVSAGHRAETRQPGSSRPFSVGSLVSHASPRPSPYAESRPPRGAVAFERAGFTDRL